MDANVFKLPQGKTISTGLQTLGIEDYSLGEDFDSETLEDFGVTKIPNLYSCCECNFNQQTWWLISIQKSYPCFSGYESYQELTYFLCKEIANPLP